MPRDLKIVLCKIGVSLHRVTLYNNNESESLERASLIRVTAFTKTSSHNKKNTFNELVSKRYRLENGPEIFRVNYISFAFFTFYDFYNLDVCTAEMCLKTDCSVKTP